MDMPPRIKVESAKEYRRGMTLLRSSRISDAERAFLSAVELDDRNYAAFAALGRLKWREHQNAKIAVDYYLLSLGIYGHNAPVLLETAEVLSLHGEPKLAEELCNHASVLAPNSPRISYIMSNISLAKGDSKAAEEYMLEAIRTDPSDLEYVNAIAILYSMIGNREDGTPIFEYLLQKDPGNPALMYNFGFFQSRYALRVQSEMLLEYGFLCGARQPARKLKATWWRGDDLTGKSIVIWREQGIGDHIRFAWVFKELVDVAGKSILVTPQKLIPLFQRTFPASQIVPDTLSDEEIDAFEADFHVPAGGIWHYRPPEKLYTFQDDGFLVPDPEKVKMWRDRLSQNGSRLRIGISWTSIMRDQLARQLGYATLGELLPLMDLPKVDFISLQYNKEAAGEIAAFEAEFGKKVHHFPEIDLFNDLDAAAGLTAALDLVISVGNSVADMSTAVGVPTFIIGTAGDGSLPPGYKVFPFNLRSFFVRKVGQEWGDVMMAIRNQIIERFGLPVPS